jgi:hypothetical protein
MPAMCSRLMALLTTIALSGMLPAAQEPAGGSVTGFVRYARGGAIPDARVVLVLRGDNIARSTRTDADGSYQIGAIAPGEYQLSVSLPGGVAKLITIEQNTELGGLDFSIPDGSSRRVVAGRVVMNAGSKGRPIPSRIGIGILRADGTLTVPLAPGDQRLVVRLPDGYFLDSVTHGTATVYSLEHVGGRRLTAGAFAITVLPEPRSIPELVVTLGSFPP